MSTKQRKEVSLDLETISYLKSQAHQAGRSLKNYMEHILTQKANDFELSDAYKKEIDAFWEREENGENTYVSEDEFRKRTNLRKSL